MIINIIWPLLFVLMPLGGQADDRSARISPTAPQERRYLWPDFEVALNLQPLRKYEYFEIGLDDENPIILRSDEKCGTAYTFHLATGETYFVSCETIAKKKIRENNSINKQPLRWSVPREKNNVLISGRRGTQQIYEVYYDAELTRLMGKFIQREVRDDRHTYKLSSYLPEELGKDLTRIFKVMDTFKLTRK